MSKTVVKQVKRLTSKEVKKISSWISSCGELKLISGENGTILKPKVLKGWVKSSEASFLFYINKTPIGFCTLSTVEILQLPQTFTEVCHLIIHPKYRNLYLGTTLLSFAMATAKHLGFSKVVGRVALGNLPSEVLLTSMRWKQFGNEKWLLNNENFNWYYKDLI